MQASRNGVAVAPPQHWATFMEDEGVQLREQVPLAPYTTLGLGGEARYFVECGSEDEVRAALTLAADGHEIAESLVSVECLDRATLERRTFTARECAFGYRDSRFKRADRGRYVVLEVTLRLARDQKPRIRYPELQRAVAGLGGLDTVTAIEAVGLVRQAVLALRRSKSMVLDPADPNTRSAGSFFTNPVLSAAAFADLAQRWKEIPSFPADGGVKVPAAWLVEHAGFPKGYRSGAGAGISTRHALALVNRGGTSADLLALAEEVRAGVEKQFGIRLGYEPEVVRSET